MPSYYFVCQECAHKFEVYCSISQKDHKKCPKCSSDKIKQLLIGGGDKGAGASKAGLPRTG